VPHALLGTGTLQSARDSGEDPGALAEAALPRITYYRCHVGHQFGALARHLPAHAEAGDDLPDQTDGTAEWATSLAESVRAQMRDAQS
jgi:hypothetical protein